MPAEATEILQKSELQAQVVQALQSHLPPQSLLWTDEQTAPFECDGLTAYRQRPLVVALPETYEQVQDILRVCHRLGVPVVARGAGTGLSGGALPHERGVTLAEGALTWADRPTELRPPLVSGDPGGRQSSLARPLAPALALRVQSDQGSRGDRRGPGRDSEPSRRAARSSRSAARGTRRTRAAGWLHAG